MVTVIKEKMLKVNVDTKIINRVIEVLLSMRIAFFKQMHSRQFSLLKQVLTESL